MVTDLAGNPPHSAARGLLAAADAETPATPPALIGETTRFG